MSVEILPIVSDLNNGGMYEVCQFKTAPNANFVTADGTGDAALPQTDMQN